MKPLALEFERSVTRLADLPDGRAPEIALLGRSNVGKSSLLNCLAGRKGLARTSNTPGRTQSLNFYRSSDYIIVDLPGYGYAKVPESVRRKWRSLIEGYLTKRQALVAGLLILDIRRVPSDLDRVMADWLSRRGIEYLAAATKADKIKRGKRAGSIRTIREDLGLPEERVVTFSTKSGMGRDKLIGWFRDMGKR